jgi:hypothetical protein
VWESIREKIASMDASAPTEAMADIYKRHEASVEEYARVSPVLARSARCSPSTATSPARAFSATRPCSPRTS